MDNGEYKFNNCQHRSQEEESVTVHRCKCQGGDYRDTGYKCNARSIFKVTSQICNYCSVFKDRNGTEIQ
jgi:hypothetical protein